MKAVKISTTQLQKGMYIRLPIPWSAHPFLFNSFKLKEAAQIELIKQLGIEEVIFLPDRSTLPKQQENQVPEDKASETQGSGEDELWDKKQKQIDYLKQYRRNLQKCEKAFEQSVTQVRSVLNKITSRPLNAVEEADQLVEEIVENLLSKDEMVLHLMNETKDGDNLYYHSLNVSVLAMMLAKSKGLSREEIKLVGMGALFHDTGKAKIPSQILNKKEPLTKAEKNFYELHPKYGVDMLSHVDSFPEDAKRIVMEHHEFRDGSGSPKQLKEEQISPLSSLVGLVNEYDRLCHPADIKKAKTPYNALSFLFKYRKSHYQPKDIDLMISQLGVYPPGSVVLMDSGQIGLVMSVNPAKLLSPNVLLFDPAIPRTEAPIVSLEDTQLKIEKSVNPRRLKPEVYEYLNPRTRISFYVEPTE